jgi:GNAT superfamily N-acetyltransferase
MLAALPRLYFRMPFFPATELRIDVEVAPAASDPSLSSLYDRLHSPGDALHGLPAFGLPDPDLRIRVREADGEFFAYVEDVRRGCLAGYTVFNRLVEVSRRADRHLRSPHSRYRPQYQRRGIATGVYEWALARGICLMTGARQSTGANALWHSLAQRHEAGYVDIHEKKLRYLGPEVGMPELENLRTRMFLLGHGWSLTRFRDEVQML